MSIIEVVVCDFCGAKPLDASYEPFGSRYGAMVWVCSSCGLTQSFYRKLPSVKIRTLSTDADWGNVRHGKGVRFEPMLKCLQSHTTPKNFRNVLDIGSNRGDFVIWMRSCAPEARIVAVEPDKSVVSRYSDLEDIELHLHKFEEVQFEDEAFDLIYSCHTLEHAKSASSMLAQMHKCLKIGGYALIEVPNLEAVSLPHIVEEYFIDKHSYHFDRQTLLAYLAQRGFEVVAGADDLDPLNLCVLVQKVGAMRPFAPVDGAVAAARNLAWIEGYKGKLNLNRKLLKSVVEQKIRPLAARQKLGFWGAGRIFDSLVKYGGLRSDEVFCLVDRFLSGIVNETHGVNIQRPEMLRTLEPQVIIILGNSAEEEMARQAYEFGVRNVVKFSELMDQVSDPV